MVVTSDLLIKVGTGAIGGLGFGLLGYFKNTKAKFDWWKILPVVVLSAIAGGVASYLDTDLSTANNMLISMGIGVGIENLFKAIYRRYC